MHLSESCVRNNMVRFHKLQATLHSARPHGDKMAAKGIINTTGEAETIYNLRNSRQPIVDHVTCLLFTTGIRMDEYHPNQFLRHLSESLASASKHLPESLKTSFRIIYTTLRLAFICFLVRFIQSFRHR